MAMSNQESRVVSRPRFHRASQATTSLVGNALVLALLVVGTAGWIVIGAWTQFPVRWFLVTNLVATITIFLVLLLLQHARAVNRLAVQTKLDELIRSSDAGNHLIGSHRFEDDMLDKVRAIHREIAETNPD